MSDNSDINIRLTVIAQQVVKACGLKQFGKAWVISAEASKLAPSAVVQEAFLRVFGEESVRAQLAGDTARVTNLFSGLCDHVLIHKPPWDLRDAMKEQGVNPDLIKQRYEFPYRL